MFHCLLLGLGEAGGALPRAPWGPEVPRMKLGKGCAPWAGRALEVGFGAFPKMPWSITPSLLPGGRLLVDIRCSTPRFARS